MKTSFVSRDTTRSCKASQTVLGDSFLSSGTFLSTPPEVLKSAKPVSRIVLVGGAPRNVPKLYL